MTQSTATLPTTEPSSRQPAATAANATAPAPAATATPHASPPGDWLDANIPLPAPHLLRAGATTAPDLVGAASASAAASDVFSSHGQPLGLDHLEHVNVFCSQAAKRDILAFLHAQAALVDVSAEARAAMGHLPAESSVWSTASWARPGATTVTSYLDGGSSSSSPIRSAQLPSPFPASQTPVPDPHGRHDPRHTSLSIPRQLAPRHTQAAEATTMDSTPRNSNAHPHSTEITVHDGDVGGPGPSNACSDALRAAPPGLAAISTLQRAAAAAVQWLPHTQALPSPASAPHPTSEGEGAHLSLAVGPSPVTTRAVPTLSAAPPEDTAGSTTPPRQQRRQQPSATDGGSVTSGPPPPSSPAHDFDVATAVGHRLLRSPPSSTHSTPASHRNNAVNAWRGQDGISSDDLSTTHPLHFPGSSGFAHHLASPSGGVSGSAASLMRANLPHGVAGVGGQQQQQQSHGEPRSGGGSTKSSHHGPHPHAQPVSPPETLSFAQAAVAQGGRSRGGSSRGGSVRGSLDVEAMAMDPSRWRQLVGREAAGLGPLAGGGPPHTPAESI
ncbi:MAG: hypothetical protein WDW36_000720 [Sanguina aurantia]